MTKNVKNITSAANPSIKALKSLSQKKHRDEEGLFIVEGERHIDDALAAGMILRTLAFSPRCVASQKMIDAASEAIETTDDILSRITGRDNTQAAIGAFAQRWTPLSDVQDGTWVGLEEIRDPGNLGTIIRTADAVGAKGVFLIGDTCDPWSPEAVRATMGSFARVEVARASLPEFLKWCSGWTGAVIGTHLDTPHDYRDVKYTAPLLLMMGSEQNGLSDAAAKSCDKLVKIPMTGGAESLNLAVATGVMLYKVAF